MRVLYDDNGVLKDVALAELLPAAFGPQQIADAAERSLRV
jgi:cytidine deaminase